MKKFPNFFPNLNQAEAPWYVRIGNLRFHYSPCQKLKEEVRVRIKINKCYSIVSITLKFIKLFATTQ